MDRKVDPSVTETALITTGGGTEPAPEPFVRFIADEGRLLPGTLLGGRYRIIGLLGVGGMGEVYRATDLTLGQSVALKFLPPEAASDQRLLERFHAEVRVARQVSHPNVCRVYDIGQADGMPFISMEYVDGEDLASLLRRIGRLPADKGIETARKICAGLAAAHDRGVIHRDLKPQNIMMNKRGEVVIMDFGLSAITDLLPGAEARNGTPAYMAPEQLRGTGVTVRSDIYSLGLVIYELFTGRRPYEASTVPQLLAQQESGRLASMASTVADIDPGVELIVRQCLDPEPARRPPSALTVAAALPGGDPLAAALAAGETPSPEMVAASGRTEGLARRYSVPCFLVVLGCLLGATVVRDRSYAFLRSPVDLPPDVLAQKSREIASSFGYARKPADSTLRLDHRWWLIRYLNSRPEPHRWNEWLAAESPVLANYRESLASLDAPPFGQVTPDNPPPTRPGMVQVVLDGRGYLREFRAAPYEGDAMSVTPDRVFEAVGFERSRFREVPPDFIPMHASDTLHAWKAPHAVLPDTEVTVEMGSWKGRVTHVRVAYPFRSSEDEQQRRQLTWIFKLRGNVMLFSAFIGMVLAVMLARRNFRLGRTDRRGAFRVALVKFVLGLVTWVGTMHPVQNERMIFHLLNGAAEWLMVTVMIWVLYLALEPAVRSHWPHSLVTWNRVLKGNWRDAEVGAHVLIGAAVGSAIWISSSAVADWIEGDRLIPGGTLSLALGVRQWLADHAGTLSTALNLSLVGFFCIFGLRRLLRRDILAALSGAVIYTALQGQVVASPHWEMMAAIFVVISAALVFVLLRFGFVATMAAIFFRDSFDAILLGVDWKTWYAPYGLATLMMLLLIATFAFWRSLGTRDLLGGPQPRP